MQTSLSALASNDMALKTIDATKKPQSLGQGSKSGNGKDALKPISKATFAASNHKSFLQVRKVRFCQ
eukprot:Skav234185  [mRNA]  locus=scaffold1413:29619:29819:- [translate_table: standard]